MQLQLDLLDHLVEAFYQKEKTAKLRHLLKISTELRFISLDQLEYATRTLNHIGSLVGGWMRQQSVLSRAREQAVCHLTRLLSGSGSHSLFNPAPGRKKPEVRCST